MLNQRIRAGWDRAMRPVGRGLAHSGLNPDAVTIIGVLIQVAAAALILDGRLLAAAFVTAAAALADVLDGAIAKARGTTGRWGALLDSTTDRLSDALLLIPIAWLYGVDPDIPERAEPWVAAVALATLVFSFLVPYTKARAESLGYECNVGIAERAERVIIVIAGLLFDVVPVAMVVLGALSAVTFVQRIAHVYRQAHGA
jgi:CDP-diacylglycerol--glycerol-3-phosphate 3-phosphatidyltransferase